MLGEVASNQFVQTWAAGSLYPRLQSGLRLRLYQNNLNVTPSTVLSDLVESTFPGYAPARLDGQFIPPVLVVPGLASIKLPEVDFTPIADDPQLVYGAFISYFSDLLLTIPFVAPVSVFAMGAIPVTLEIQVWALASAC